MQSSKATVAAVSRPAPSGSSPPRTRLRVRRPRGRRSAAMKQASHHEPCSAPSSTKRRSKSWAKRWLEHSDRVRLPRYTRARAARSHSGREPSTECNSTRRLAHSTSVRLTRSLATCGWGANSPTREAQRTTYPAIRYQSEAKLGCTLPSQCGSISMGIYREQIGRIERAVTSYRTPESSNASVRHCFG